MQTLGTHQLLKSLTCTSHVVCTCFKPENLRESEIVELEIPVVPARGGAEVALKIYMRPFSSIELARAVHQPSPCVRALCESGVLFHMSHFKLDFTLHTSHCTLHTSHFTLETSQSTLLTSHCFLRTPHFTLHTALFRPHTSHCTLHTPHFISSELFSALLHVSKVERNSC